MSSDVIVVPKERTWKPTTAGVLNIISGVLGIIGGVFLVISPRLMIDLMDMGSLYGTTPSDRAALQFTLNMLVVGGIIWLIMGIIAIIGGVFSTKRKKWGLGLAASIMAIILTLVLGVLSTIFISLGRKEFT